MKQVYCLSIKCTRVVPCSSQRNGYKQVWPHLFKKAQNQVNPVSTTVQDRLPVESTSTNHEQNTTYEDAVEVAQEQVMSSMISSSLRIVNPTMPSLMDKMFERSFPVYSGAWSNQAAGTLLTTLDFPKVLFDIPFINDKLRWYTYYRTGVQLEFRINGTKFHYGMLMASWDPSTYNNANTLAESSLVTASGFPHILLSPSTNVTPILTIPFISPKTCLTISSDNQLGSVDIVVLNPLSMIGPSVSTLITYTVFAKFVSFELFGPSPNSLPIPSASVTRRPTRFHAPLITDIEIQSISREAISKQEKGVITKTLEQVSSVTSGLENFPLIGSFMPLVANVSKSMSHISSALGFNKPTTVCAPQRVDLMFASDLVSGRGLDNSLNLGIDPENQVCYDPTLMGSDVDQMSIKYLAAMPSLYGTIAWNTGAAPGTTLLVLPVRPTFCYNDQVSTYYPTILAKLSMPFVYWRGTLKYKIYICCTQFHTGRLRIAFNPTLSVSGLPYTYNSFNKIVDIQTQTEVEFSVPFMYPYAWSDGSIGNITIQVLNELYTLDSLTVSPIFLNMYFAAEEDFKVNFIYGKRFVPIPYVPPEITEIEVQSLPRTDFTKVFENIAPDYVSLQDKGLNFGESLDSLRTILHRYEKIPNKFIGPNPNSFCFSGMTQAPLEGDVTGYAYPLFYHYHDMFLAKRGSMRLKCVLNTGVSAQVEAYMLQTASHGPYWSYNDVRDGYNTVAFNPAYKPLVEVQIPYYSKQLWYHTSTQNQEAGPAVQLLSTKPEVLAPFSYISIGDDFSFGFVKGIRPSHLIGN